MSYDKTVQDIIDYTGLKYDYIRKCLSKFNNIFEPHIKRGDKNSLLFNSNALQIFDQIKQMKDQGFTLNIIEEQLANVPTSKPMEGNNQTPHNMEQTEYLEAVLKELKDANKEALQAKEQTIQAKNEALKAKEEHIKALESKILLITDGRSPEQVRQEQRQKDETLQRKTEELFTIQNELKQREMEINSIKAIAESKAKELEEQKKVFEELKSKEKLKEEKKRVLLSQLKKLEGKFFQTKRKKELLEQLEALNYESLVSV